MNTHTINKNKEETAKKRPQAKVNSWLNQEDTVTEQLDNRLVASVETANQAQATQAETEAPLAQLPDSAELSTRMAESEALQAEIDSTAAPDAENLVSEMIATYQTQLTTYQAEIEAQWNEAKQLMADHS